VLLYQADVEAVVSMCTADNIDQLLAGQPDFVLDAIDNIHTKVRRAQQADSKQQTHKHAC
jgi:tRNA A37 threonylcarbamoyladenosine dehydratase